MAATQTPENRANAIKDGEEVDLDAAWDDVVLLEDRAAQRGIQEGLTEGIQRGERQGFRIGAAKGAEIGAEVGFYLGFATTWTQVRKRNPEESSKKEERLSKALAKLASDADAFPAENVKDEDVLQRLRDMRARFKMCCQMLGVAQEMSQPGGGRPAAQVITW